MARTTLEDKLAAITALERQPVATDPTEQWRGWLLDSQNLVVARVAEPVWRHT